MIRRGSQGENIPCRRQPLFSKRICGATEPVQGMTPKFRLLVNWWGKGNVSGAQPPHCHRDTGRGCGGLTAEDDEPEK